MSKNQHRHHKDHFSLKAIQAPGQDTKLAMYLPKKKKNKYTGKATLYLRTDFPLLPFNTEIVLYVTT